MLAESLWLGSHKVRTHKNCFLPSEPFGACDDSLERDLSDRK